MPDRDGDPPGEDAGARRTYHHGNLRQGLIDAALPLIEAKGPLGFTLAEAARGVGVSSAAPYRHFRGRDDLIEAVAEQGFELFAEQLEAAWNNGRPSPLSAFMAIGRAYLAFARSRPAHYMAMFEGGVSIAANPELARAADGAMAILHRAAERLAERLPADRRPPATMVANHVWAFSHGVVELFGRGKPGARAPYSADEMLESGVVIYLQGLGLIPS